MKDINQVQDETQRTNWITIVHDSTTTFKGLHDQKKNSVLRVLQISITNKCFVLTIKLSLLVHESLRIEIFTKTGS